MDIRVLASFCLVVSFFMVANPVYANIRTSGCLSGVILERMRHMKPMDVHRNCLPMTRTTMTLVMFFILSPFLSTLGPTVPEITCGSLGCWFPHFWQQVWRLQTLVSVQVLACHDTYILFDSCHIYCFNVRFFIFPSFCFNASFTKFTKRTMQLTHFCVWQQLHLFLFFSRTCFKIC